MSESIPLRTTLRPDINITPLVDVVLVLLIIFMVIAPQLEAGITVNLPAMAHPDQGNAALDGVTVTLAKNGAIYLEKEQLSRETLLERLSAIHAAKPSARVVLKADAQLPYGKVRELLKACQGLGLAGASLQVIDVANKRG